MNKLYNSNTHTFEQKQWFTCGCILLKIKVLFDNNKLVYDFEEITTLQRKKVSKTGGLVKKK